MMNSRIEKVVVAGERYLLDENKKVEVVKVYGLWYCRIKYGTGKEEDILIYRLTDIPVDKLF